MTLQALQVPLHSPLPSLKQHSHIMSYRRILRRGSDFSRLIQLGAGWGKQTVLCLYRRDWLATWRRVEATFFTLISLN